MAPLRCIIGKMNILLLAALLAATTSNPKTNKGTVTPDGTTPTASSDKKAKKVEAPAPLADPVSLVPAGAIDAATQIANAAAKAAMDEIAKLNAIGSDSAAPAGTALVDGKTLEAAVTGTAAVTKELKGSKKKAPATEAGDSTPPPPKAEKKTKAAAAPTEGNTTTAEVKVSKKAADEPAKE